MLLNVKLFSFIYFVQNPEVKWKGGEEDIDKRAVS